MYKKVIDILMSEGVDFKAIGIEIAKTNPSVFLKAYNALNCTLVEAPVKTPTQCFIEKYGADFYEKIRINFGQYTRLVERHGDKVWLKDLLILLFPHDYCYEKIKAIKLIRSEEKMGLKAAKEFCEAMIEGSVPNLEDYNY